MTAGPPSHSGVQGLRWTRERLLRLGLTEDHIVLAEAPKQARLSPTDLEPAHYAPEFAPLVQRLQRLLRTGRGLSVYVTGRRNDALARQHAASQIALGLAPLGRQVVIVDVDFLRPGLGGLVPDPEAEGVIDMVRFGRSVRSLLLRPVAEGPWLLSAGSFPVEDPMPLGPEALRSLVYRVSQVCDLALYVGPLPAHEDLNPLARVCDHVIYATQDDDSESGQLLVDAIGELQKQNAHVAGVVIDAGELEPVLLPEASSPSPSPSVFEPGFLYTPPEEESPRPWSPPTAPVEPRRAAFEPPQPERSAPPPASLPPIPAPTVASRSATAPPPTPEIPAAPRFERMWDVPEAKPAASAGDATDLGAGAHRFATRHDADDEEERMRRDLASAITSRAVQRPNEEAKQLGDDLDLVDSEFAIDEDGRYSRTPLYLLITLIVLILGFGGWLGYQKWGRQRDIDVASAPQTSVAPPASKPSSGAVKQPEEPRSGGSTPGTQRPSQSPVQHIQPRDGDANRSTTPSNAAPSTGTSASSPPATTPTSPANEPRSRTSTSTSPVPRPSAGETRPQTPTPPPTSSQATGNTPVPPPRTQAPVTAPPASGTPQSGTSTTTPSAPPSSSSPKTAAGGEYAVHVASYKKTEQALRDIATLQKYGYEGRYVKTDLGSKGIWYRVYVGSYPTAAEAEKVRQALLKLPEYKSYAQVTRMPRE